jgi:putative DNA primase/helicase
MSDFLSAALQYAGLGWRVHPLRPRGKVPLLNDWPSKATTDLDTIRGWWRQWPTANVGLVCGGTSNFWVLDIDGAVGAESLALLEDQHGRLPITVEQQTGGGGRHLFFRWPAGYVIRNSASVLGPGLDVRGEGGQVAVAPSLHPSGGRYEWLADQDPASQQIAEAPGWLLALVAQRATKAVATPGSNGHQKGIAAGERNNRLTSIAGSLRRKGLGEQTIAAALEAINVEECTEPLEASEVARIAKSVARYEPAPDDADPPTRDLGHAQTLAGLFRDRLRWCSDWGRWLQWTGTHWGEVTNEEVARAAAEALRRHYAEQIAATSDKNRMAELTRAVLEACTYSRIQGALGFLRGWPGVITRASELDNDPWLLNVANGTLDLRTGDLRPHNPGDLCTKVCGVGFDPTADTGAWERHISMVLPNPNIRREVQRSLGLALVGEHLEERLDLWFGTGQNGKSVTITALLNILGDYAVRAAPDLLVQSKFDRHPTEVADLQGRRLVFSVEVDQGKRLAEALVKDLTGGDRLKARYMRQDFFEFKPTHSLFLAVNHKPTITGQDLGIWRRVRLIPWEVTIPPDQRRPQNEVVADLVADGAAILRWLLEGLADWQRDHNWTAPEVQAATQQYKAEQDILGAFLAERCETGPRYSVGVAELFEAYEKHCSEAGEDPVKKTTFGRLLRQRGFDQQRDGHGRDRKWVGLRLRTNADKDSISSPKHDSWGTYTENVSAFVRTADEPIPSDWQAYLELAEREAGL